MLDGTMFTGATLDRIALDDITALPLTPAALPPALTPTSRVLPCKVDMRLLPHAFIRRGIRFLHVQQDRTDRVCAVWICWSVRNRGERRGIREF